MTEAKGASPRISFRAGLELQSRPATTRPPNDLTPTRPSRRTRRDRGPDPSNEQRASSLASLSRGLSRATTGRTAANQAGDPKEAAEDVEQAAQDLDSLTEDEQKELARKLAELGAAAGGADGASATALRDAAQSLGQGNTSAARDALDRLPRPGCGDRPTSSATSPEPHRALIRRTAAADPSRGTDRQARAGDTPGRGARARQPVAGQAGWPGSGQA
jgi:hypothetical protein